MSQGRVQLAKVVVLSPGLSVTLQNVPVGPGKEISYMSVHIIQLTRKGLMLLLCEKNKSYVSERKGGGGRKKENEPITVPEKV